MKKNIIINNIQKIRAKNNKYWMDLMRLAFKFAPNESSQIIKKINQQDQEISALLKKLSN
jgi:hypothetical protein